MAKQKRRVSKKETKRDICFVIMPFGGWFDSYYEEIYKPAVVNANLDPLRSDDLYKPSQIVQDIWNCTKKAKLLLADLTGKNPNVFYELGLAHALAKPVVLVTESADDIPFDLRSLRYILYDKNEPNWSALLKKSISNAIKEVVGNPGESILQAFVDTQKKTQTSLPLKKQLLLLESRIKDLTRQNVELGHKRIDIGPREAEVLILTYLKQGAPRSLIVQRLANMGVPAGWVVNTISRLKKEKGKNLIPH